MVGISVQDMSRWANKGDKGGKRAESSSWSLLTVQVLWVDWQAPSGVSVLSQKPPGNDVPNFHHHRRQTTTATSPGPWQSMNHHHHHHHHHHHDHDHDHDYQHQHPESTATTIIFIIIIIIINNNHYHHYHHDIYDPKPWTSWSCTTISAISIITSTIIFIGNIYSVHIRKLCAIAFGPCSLPDCKLPGSEVNPSFVHTMFSYVFIVFHCRRKMLSRRFSDCVPIPGTTVHQSTDCFSFWMSWFAIMSLSALSWSGPRWVAIASESHPAISDGYAQVGWTHQAGIPIDFRLRRHQTRRYVWQYPIPSTGPSIGKDGHSIEGQTFGICDSHAGVALWVTADAGSRQVWSQTNDRWLTLEWNSDYDMIHFE